MTKIAATAWPKPYLLKIYTTAIEKGCFRIPLEDETQFKSLNAAFLRLRRRTDAQHGMFIEESYHLVSMTWEKERKTALVVYDRLPDGEALPEFQDVDSSEMPSSTAVKARPLPVSEPSAETPLEPPPFDSQALVENLISKISFNTDDDTGLE